MKIVAKTVPKKIKVSQYVGKESDEILATYIKSLEEKNSPIQIRFGVANNCFRVSPYIIKKVFIPNNNRINWELDALKKLEKYHYFPKVLLTDRKNGVFYMTDVGLSIKNYRHTGDLPGDLFKQIDNMIKALRAVEIFHRDLSLEHLRIKDGRVSLIDFEKCFLTNKQYEENKTANTATWQKLTYYDMDQAKVIVQEYYNKLLDRENKKKNNK